MVYRKVSSDEADVRPPSIVQVSLVLDSQTNATQLSAEDVYVKKATNDTQVPGLREITNTSRFKVLKTQLFCLNDTASSTDGANTTSVTGNAIPFTWYVPQNQVINYIAGAGAGSVADIRDYSYHVIASCDANPDSSNCLKYNCRVRFVG